jgi:ATP-dependent protease ClpP protease subunit
MPVVVTARRDPDLAFGGLVDEPLFVGDPSRSRPVTRDVMLERFRLPNALIAVADQILVIGHLDAKMAQRVSAQLLLLDRTDLTRPIELHLSCRDSDLAASLVLAAAVDLTSAQVHAVVTATL